MSQPSKRRPIGVFDSGVGGLSVLQAIRDTLPTHGCVYVADSKFVPYGDRDAAFIVERSNLIAKFLLANDVCAIVIACNTATAAAAAELRAWCSIPVVAMEPAIKPASLRTVSGIIGVLATSRTITGANVERLRANFGANTTIKLQPCPGLVEQVERGEIESQQTKSLLQKYLSPLIEADADTIVLGCTHYSFLGDTIAEICGANIAVIDPAPAVAKQLSRRLSAINDSPTPAHAREYRFVATGDVDLAAIRISRLWGAQVKVESIALAGSPPVSRGAV